MDYHQLYNTGCSRYNQFSTTFPPNRGIPQEFARHVGLEGHVYDPRHVVTYDYTPYTQMWNIPQLQAHDSRSDPVVYPDTDTAISRQRPLNVAEHKPTFSGERFHDNAEENDAVVDDRKENVISELGFDTRMHNGLDKTTCDTSTSKSHEIHGTLK